MRELAEARGLKAAALIHATRVAVTGKATSPGLFEVLELLGRERTARRLEAAAAADSLLAAHVYGQTYAPVLMSVGCDSAHALH